jgi:exopolysaccharide biosynthesis polyprenyl glycosylphosphotransferase
MPHRRLQRFLKRGLDILVSAPLLLLTLPLLPLLALLIRLDSRGPVFYRQTRVGRGGRPFHLVKLRTMTRDAEASGPVWSRRGDPRATRLGGWLRRTGLDEFPQLWNVVKGDMSLVGPRPERPEFVAQFEREIPGYAGRHALRPGITGWAQVHGLRGDTSIPERTRYDLEYIQQGSLWLDLKILLRTPFTMEMKDRTYPPSPLS